MTFKSNMGIFKVERESWTFDAGPCRCFRLGQDGSFCFFLVSWAYWLLLYVPSAFVRTFIKVKNHRSCLYSNGKVLMCLVHACGFHIFPHRYNGTPVGALTDATFVDDLLEGIACQVSSVTPILADAVHQASCGHDRVIFNRLWFYNSVFCVFWFQSEHACVPWWRGHTWLVI